jgi:hypothetical protein
MRGDALTRFYAVAGLIALAFFSYAQHQGMSPFGNRGVQPMTSQSGASGSSWRSGGLSHK